MTVQEILKLGNPELYRVSEEVEESELDEIKGVVQDLHDTMMNFREEYGIGRAIAAPQIGVMKRVVYMHIDSPVAIINPVLRDKSDEMIELWDDCMCFPDLLVRVRRHRRCTIEYRDLDWSIRSMNLEDDLSELLQHEYDHLDGILATMRAIDEKSFASTSQRYLL